MLRPCEEGAGRKGRRERDGEGGREEGAGSPICEMVGGRMGKERNSLQSVRGLVGGWEKREIHLQFIIVAERAKRV